MTPVLEELVADLAATVRGLPDAELVVAAAPWLRERIGQLSAPTTAMREEVARPARARAARRAPEPPPVDEANPVDERVYGALIGAPGSLRTHEIATSLKLNPSAVLRALMRLKAKSRAFHNGETNRGSRWACAEELL